MQSYSIFAQNVLVGIQHSIWHCQLSCAHFLFRAMQDAGTIEGSYSVLLRTFGSSICRGCGKMFKVGCKLHRLHRSLARACALFMSPGICMAMCGKDAGGRVSRCVGCHPSSLALHNTTASAFEVCSSRKPVFWLLRI